VLIKNKQNSGCQLTPCLLLVENIFQIFSDLTAIAREKHFPSNKDEE